MSEVEIKNKIFANAFNLIVELGPIKITKLMNYFSDLEAAWQAARKDLATAGLDGKSIEAILTARPKIDPKKSFEELNRAGIEIILGSDQVYPAILKQIASTPPILYIRGSQSALKQSALAIVGTRKMSLYGRQTVQELVPGLVRSGLAIVSGLAFGVDAETLATCLNAGGTPIAVLASSIDDQSISPRANFNLAQKIIKSGCLVSEYPLGSNVQKQNFPIRNRIISGLALGTLVIEAGVESGALITANYALEQNREVFAIPGSIFSATSSGTNNLIKKGAKLVNSYQDVLDELNIADTIAEPLLGIEESEAENILLSHLTKLPVHIDELIKQLKFPASEINSTLTLLEIKGRVKNLGGNNYIRVR